MSAATAELLDYAEVIARYEPVLGLEVHVELSTETKMFCSCANRFGGEPNTQVCPVCLGMPGSLPVLNQVAVESAIRIDLALNCEIVPWCRFTRKNYFYPDMPKNYQISQYDEPIAINGHLEVPLDDGSTWRVEIERAHMEEDTGKLTHLGSETGRIAGATTSLIDYNRAGVPLIEIVTKPVEGAGERAPEIARAYVTALRDLLRGLGVSDVRMDQGSMRCDSNVSLKPIGQAEFGTRTETKNLNSFRFVEKAINYEIERQIDVIESGGEIVQETRLFNTQSGETRAMRSKEEANDYRYFPDPDLLPVVTTESDILGIRTTMPELPDAKRARFVEQYDLSDYDAGVLTSSRELADYYEKVVEYTGTTSAKLSANWVMGDLAASLNAENLDIADSRVDAKTLAGLVNRIADDTISGKIAKDVFIAMWNGEGDADAIIDAKGLKQITDPDALGKILDEVIAGNPTQLEQYRSGKDKLFGYFVGRAMKATKGKANPAEVNRLLKEKLQG